MYSDPVEYNRQMLAYNQFVMQSQMQAFAAPMLAQQASFAKAEARRNTKTGFVWEKYADEIEAQMANVPLQARTQEAWEMAAKIVAADHLDEIAQTRAEVLRASGDSGTVSGDGNILGSAAAPRDPLEQLFADDDPAVARLKAIGKGPDDVRKTALAMRIPLEDYIASLKRGSVVVHSQTGTPKTGIEAQHATTVQA